MKKLQYFALVALLLSSMTAGCNSSWNPFREKPVVTDPPLTGNLGAVDGAGAGALTSDPNTIGGTGTVITTAPPTTVYTPPVTSDPVVSTPPTTSAGTTYTIKKGDNLWRIAVNHLGNGQRHKEILAMNPGLQEKKLPIG